MPHKPLDQNLLCFLRVTVQRAEVSKASNHRVGAITGECCAGWQLVFCIGQFLKRPGRVPFSIHTSQSKYPIFVMTDFLVTSCNKVTCSVDRVSPLGVRLQAFGCKHQNVVAEPPDFHDSVQLHEYGRAAQPCSALLQCARSAATPEWRSPMPLPVTHVPALVREHVGHDPLLIQKQVHFLPLKSLFSSSSNVSNASAMRSSLFPLM